MRASLFLLQETSAFKQMVSNNVGAIKQQHQIKKLKRRQYSLTSETKGRKIEDAIVLDTDFIEIGPVDDDLCISVPEVIAMPSQVSLSSLLDPYKFVNHCLHPHR